MPDRIFTTNEAPEGLGPAEAINTIDVASVAKTMKDMTEGSVPDPNPEIITQIASSEFQPEGPIDKIKITDPSKAPKPQSRFAINTKGVCEVCGVPHPCSHDVMEARKASNDDAVALMNEVRNQRRLAMLNAHQQQVRQAQAAERQVEAQKEAINKGLADLEAAVKEAEKAEKAEKPKKASKTSNEEPKFESLADMSASKRDTFAKWADKQGWPREYVESMLSKREIEASVPREIRVIAEREDIDEEQKRDIITAMFKGAELEQDQADRIRRFWKEELGYQDAEWVDDLVAEPDNK